MKKMKSLLYISLTCLLLLASACKEDEQPYVGYINIGRALLEAGNGTTTITADTDISSPILVEVDELGAEWCTVTTNGKQITVTATEANPSADSPRNTTVQVKCGYRATSFTVLQKYEGQKYLDYDWSGWSATGSDVQASDGGGYPSLFTDDRTTFWHSQYSPALETPLPHTITVDMKKALKVDMVRVGRRHYAANGNNYATVKTMEVYASTDGTEYTLGGKFTFALPWTAPDGTVVTGATSPLIPGYEDVAFDAPITARYIRLIITETNNTTGACQVSYVKAYEEL